MSLRKRCLFFVLSSACAHSQDITTNTSALAGIPVAVIHDGRTANDAEISAILRTAGFIPAANQDEAGLVLEVTGYVRRGKLGLDVFAKDRTSRVLAMVTSPMSTQGNVLTLWVQHVAGTASISNAEVHKDEMSALARAFEELSESQSLQQWGVEWHRREAASRARAEAVAIAAARQREQALRAAKTEDEAAWASSNFDRCMTPSSADACDGVKSYLSAQPLGMHVDEAKRHVDNAGPSLRRLQDDAAWHSARITRCRTPTVPNDCEDVRTYLKTYPQGLHARDAKAMLSKARVALDRAGRHSSRRSHGAIAAQEHDQRHRRGDSGEPRLAQPKFRDVAEQCAPVVEQEEKQYSQCVSRRCDRYSKSGSEPNRLSHAACMDECARAQSTAYSTCYFALSGSRRSGMASSIGDHR